jgi:hypothetical protein
MNGIEQAISLGEYFSEGIKEITSSDEFYTGDFSYITIQVFDIEQYQTIVMPLLALLDIKEYYVSSGLNRNSGWVNHQTPIITFKVPKKKCVDSLTLCLGSFGSNIKISLD